MDWGWGWPPDPNVRWAVLDIGLFARALALVRIRTVWRRSLLMLLMLFIVWLVGLLDNE
jgi:hypothetical protein